MRTAPAAARRPAFPALLLALAFAAAARSAPSDGAPAPSAGGDAAATTPGARAGLADVAWLAGSWRLAAGGGSLEEHWLEPAGGMMLGLNRTVRPDGRASFEYLRIVDAPEGVVYLASPGGSAPTPFPLVEVTAGRAVFANSEHDFPKRIIYARDGDRLTARIEGDDGQGMEWTWTRASFVAAQP